MEISDAYVLHDGVPQGSCLGPLLFLLYCNDLPKILESCSCILFADDTTLYKSHENLRYLKWVIQEDLCKLMDWFRANKLTLNLTKSVCMLFPIKRKSVNLDIKIENIVLPNVKNTKYLGCWVNCNLN